MRKWAGDSKRVNLPGKTVFVRMDKKASDDSKEWNVKANELSITAQSVLHLNIMYQKQEKWFCLPLPFSGLYSES